MKKELYRTVQIPEGVNVSMDENVITVKGPEGENSKKFNFGRLDVSIEGNEIKLGNKNSTKNEKKMMNTIGAHLENMIKGVQEKFVYELKVCSGHFPMTVKKEGNKAIIKNFLGEKVDRICELLPGVDVDINKNEIIVKSVSKELAGQTAANFEAATKIKGRDKRIFQDGVYIIKKAGKEI
jgi:large subunit ribosomal protein L6